MKTAVLTVALSLSFACSYAQSGFKKTYFLTDDSVNRTLWPSAGTHNLAGLLFDGYLKKKIRCFGEPVMNDAVYGPSIINPAWQSWSEKKWYEIDDTVIFDNEYFVCTGRYSPTKSSPKSDVDTWQPFTPERPLIENNYHFPFEKNELSQQDFYERMIQSQNFSALGTWDSKMDYWPGDLVEFQGKVYQATMDNKNVVVTDMYTWQDQGPMYSMFQPSSMNFIGLLDYYEIQKGDTVYFSQMLSVGGQRNDGSYSPLLYFNFQDVIKFLETLQQPIVSFKQSPRYGLLKNQNFLFENELQKVQLVMWISDKIKSKKLKMNKKVSSEYIEMFSKDERLSATLPDSLRYDPYACPWSLCLSTLDFSEMYITYRNLETNTLPEIAFKLSTKAVSALLRQEPGNQRKTEVMTYGQALTSRSFYPRYSELYEIDTLQATKNVIPCKEPQLLSYHEIFSANFTSPKNKLLTQHALEIGKVFVELAKNSTVESFALSYQSYETNDQINDLMMKEGYDRDLFETGSVLLQYPMPIGITVIHEITFSKNDLPFSAVPRYIAVQFDYAHAIGYFKIDDLKRWSATSGNVYMKELLAAVEGRKFDFSRSEIVDYVKALR